MIYASTFFITDKKTKNNNEIITIMMMIIIVTAITMMNVLPILMIFEYAVSVQYNTIDVPWTSLN